MRFLRSITGFSRFAKQYPLYAKADFIATQFPEYFQSRAGRVGNPTIVAKEAPAPTAESGEVAAPGTVPKGPERQRRPLGALAKSLLRPRAKGASSRGSRPTAR